MAHQDCVRPLRRPIIGPRYVATTDILGALVPLEAYVRCGAEVGFSKFLQRLGKGIGFYAHSIRV
jgi:hypothetical protein